MSHIVVAIFIAIAAFLLWLTRRPQRTWAIAFPVGGVAVAFERGLAPAAAVATDVHPEHAVHEAAARRVTTRCRRGSRCPDRCATRSRACGTRSGVRRSTPTRTRSSTSRRRCGCRGGSGCSPGSRSSQPVGIAGARPSCSLVLAFVVGVMFIEWPEHAIWNTRFLPFWMLSWAFLAAMGATEIARLVAMVVRPRVRVDTRRRSARRARPRVGRARDRATTTSSPIEPEAAQGRGVGAGRPPLRSRARRAGSPPARLSDRRRREVRPPATARSCSPWSSRWRASFALHQGNEAPRQQSRRSRSAVGRRGTTPATRAKPTYPQYHAIMTGMEQVADTHGNGRAFWEPSSGDPDAINSYGTSLALMLLPYFTHGKIDSMEGIYFESSATTDYHFLTVSECAEHPSNPVRGLVYGNPDCRLRSVRAAPADARRALLHGLDDGDAEARRREPATHAGQGHPAEPADRRAGTRHGVEGLEGLRGCEQRPRRRDGPRAGRRSRRWPSGRPTYSKCWGTSLGPGVGRRADACRTAGSARPRRGGSNRDELGTAYAESGPSDWMRVKASDLAKAQPPVVTPVQVSNVATTVDKISFDVSDIGKPVEVKESYFPNWQISGAKGPYRLAPNLMVVVPTSKHVRVDVRADRRRLGRARHHRRRRRRAGAARALDAVPARR